MGYKIRCKFDMGIPMNVDKDVIVDEEVSLVIMIDDRGNHTLNFTDNASFGWKSQKNLTQGNIQLVDMMLVTYEM